jgi:hypothetical protein
MQPIHSSGQDPQIHARALKLAYAAGYGDAVFLLRPDGGDCACAEPVERVQARHLGYVAMAHPTEEAVAYMSGFGDAAADNLPCPPPGATSSGWATARSEAPRRESLLALA